MRGEISRFLDFSLARSHVLSSIAPPNPQPHLRLHTPTLPLPLKRKKPKQRLSMGKRERVRVASAVIVNVYDLSKQHAEGFNDYTHEFGLGLYHSGVEVNGVEYSFGSGAGIFTCTPQIAPPAVFRCSVKVGETRLGYREISRLVDEMRP